MPFGMDDVTFEITADAASATRSIDSVKKDLATMSAPAKAAGAAIDSVGDAMSSAAAKAAVLSRTGKLAASAVDKVGDQALGATGKLVAFGGTLGGIGLTATVVAGQIGLVAGAIGAIGIAAAPVVAALGGIAIAFGAIIGSGIYAGMDRLSKAFKQATKQIKPMIKAFGKQFVPLLMDAIQALPGLVRSIIKALGPMDQFKNALRTLGRAALRFLPKLIGFLVDIGRKAIPIFTDVSLFIMQNLVPAFRTLVNWGFKLWRAIADLVPPFSKVQSAGNSLWKTLQKLAPSVTQVSNFIRKAIGFVRGLVRQFRNGVNNGENLFQKLNDIRVALIDFWKQSKPTRAALARLGKALAKTAGIVVGLALDVLELAIRLRGKLQPAFTFIVNTVTRVIKWLNKALVAVRTLGTNVSKQATRMNKAWTKVRRLGQMTMTTFRQIRRIITRSLNYIWNNVIQPLLANIQQLWKLHGAEIKQSVNQLLNALIGLFRFLKRTATQIWNAFGDEIMAIVDFFAKTVVTVLTGAFDTLITMFDVVTDLLAGDWKGAWNAMKGLLNRTLGRMESIFGAFVDMLKTVLSGAVDWITGRWSDFFDALLRISRNIVNGVADWFGRLPEKLGRYVNQFVNKGEAFIQGVIDGIRNKAGRLVNQAEGMARDAANAIIDTFNRLMPDGFSIPEITIGGGSWNPPGPGQVDIPTLTIGGQSINIPQLASGGFVEETGLAMIHEGETVVPARVSDRGETGDDVTIGDIYVDATGADDPDQVATEISNELRSVFSQ